MFLILWQSDAQPTIDDSESCTASDLEKVTSIVTREFDEVKNLLASNPFDAADPSKQALVSALVCKYR